MSRFYQNWSAWIQQILDIISPLSWLPCKWSSTRLNNFPKLVGISPLLFYELMWKCWSYSHIFISNLQCYYHADQALWGSLSSPNHLKAFLSHCFLTPPWWQSYRLYKNWQKTRSTWESWFAADRKVQFCYVSSSIYLDTYPFFKWMLSSPVPSYPFGAISGSKKFH